MALTVRPDDAVHHFDTIWLGPAGVLGSLTWALAPSALVSRAVMLVVDAHEPPAGAFGAVRQHRFGSRRIGRP